MPTQPTFVNVAVPHLLDAVSMHLSGPPVALVHVSLAPHEGTLPVHHAILPIPLVTVPETTKPTNQPITDKTGQGRAGQDGMGRADGRQKRETTTPTPTTKYY